MLIFPAIDLRGGQCVRLRQGDYSRETVFGDDPVAMARRWRDAGAEWLHLVDLDGAKRGRPVNHEVVRRIVQGVGIPCQLGGGLRDEAAIRLMLEDVGVTRVILGTAALKQPDWFAEMASRFPGRLCLGIDARESMVATEGWLDVSQTPALELARQFAALDLGAIIYTNIANDGMLQGIDPGTLADLAALADLGLPVIASGGVTTIEDIRRLRGIGADHPQLTGAIVGRALYEGTLTLAEALTAARG
jgi:phosphoribosylformimino-5-aminoimidazole carboxamide ribotide isomerase